MSDCSGDDVKYWAVVIKTISFILIGCGWDSWRLLALYDNGAPIIQRKHT